MRLLAILLMCAATVCFSGIDSSAKWLGMRLPEAEVVWARYVGAAIFSVMVARPWTRPQTFRANRPWLQLFRSALLLGSTYANFLALRQLQLAETSTISFLSPLFVALMAGPWLGERVGGARMAAIAVGFLGVVIATRPGTSAFQPIVFVAIGAAVCNAAYGLATRMLAGGNSPETTLVWTPLAGMIAMTPFLPWFWVTPQGPLVWAIMALLGASGAFGDWLMILSPISAPRPRQWRLRLYPTAVDDRHRLAGVRRRAARRDADRGRDSHRLRRLPRLARAQRQRAEAEALVTAARSPI